MASVLVFVMRGYTSRECELHLFHLIYCYYLDRRSLNKWDESTITFSTLFDQKLIFVVVCLLAFRFVLFHFIAMVVAVAAVASFVVLLTLTVFFWPSSFSSCFPHPFALLLLFACSFRFVLFCFVLFIYIFRCCFNSRRGDA